jgi:CobQ-like glutamine amidotransferase family enzyme
MLETPWALGWTWKISYSNNKGHQDIEGLKALDTMSKDTKKYIGDVAKTKVENNFIFFSN